MANWEKFGPEIRILRGDKSIQEIAGLAGIDRGHLSRLENSKSRPTEDTVKSLARALNVDPDMLLSLAGYLPQAVNRLPILGTIRAGVPILAQESCDGYLDVPESIRADFVLRVTGDSMIGAGILDGDYAICRENQEPQTGQIIVALKDEGSTSEATLKFYFNGSGEPKLKPANPTYPEYDYIKDGYHCAGHMVALIREDSPGYQTYKEYITVAGHEEWTEVIELATEAGLKVSQVKEILAGQIEIAKKLKN